MFDFHTTDLSSLFASTRATHWRCADVMLDLRRPQIMGILNVTPDSFSDGGEHAQLAQAIAWARRMKDEGADIIDVGGESTRPGFDEEGVSLEEERRRVIPVVQALLSEGFCVSVDTSKPEIMLECARLGVHILNDIRGFTQPGALEAAASTTCGLCVMHRAHSTDYADLLEDIESFLLTQTELLKGLGVSADRICWDPGFGFGKTVEQNYQLMAATDRWVESGYPVLMGLSRKSSIGAVTGHSAPKDRVVGSVTGAVLCADLGAQILRVHDCLATRDGLSVWAAFKLGTLANERARSDDR